MVRSSDVSPLGTKSTLLRSNRSVVALLTDVAFVLFGRCRPLGWCYVRLTTGATSDTIPCIISVWLVCGDADIIHQLFERCWSARLLLSNTSQYCWLICEVSLLPNCLYCWYLVTVQHLLMFRGAVSAKFRGQFYSVFHINGSLDIRIDFLRRGGIN